MMQLVVLGGIVAWVGATMALADLRWFRRPRLVERLAPYQSSSLSARRNGVFSVASLRELIGPLCTDIGGWIAKAVGISEPISERLRRIHSSIDATAFRVRQVGWSISALGLGAMMALSGALPPLISLGALVALPLMTFLVLEQQLAKRSGDWQRRLFLEMPIISEQLGMLLCSGWSLGAALSRLAKRGDGCTALDLARVCSRIQQGVAERDALREWSELAGVDAVDRLVTVLALNRETTDLGRLISEEARAIRAEAHRHLLAALERRAEMVWIPVTVATLVPGVIFLSIPFIEVMRVFATR